MFLFLEETYGTVRFIEEKRVGRSRADILMVTEESLIGIEIKSDADSYQRLESQVRDYDKSCDLNMVAVGSSHAMHIEEHVPDYWGIITIDEIDGAPDFYILRRPKRNPCCRPDQQIKILWRRELAHIQEINRMPAYKDKSKAFVRRKILERIPRDILRRQFCQELLERDYTTIEEDIRSYRKKAGKSPGRVRKYPRRRGRIH